MCYGVILAGVCNRGEFEQHYSRLQRKRWETPAKILFNFFVRTCLSSFHLGSQKDIKSHAALISEQRSPLDLINTAQALG